MSNSAKGRSSYDSTATGSLIHFFNRNISEYPTEIGASKFELVPVEKQKDIMLNVARLHAQQEYNRIMDLVNVLQKQAAQIKRRLDITDLVHSAEYKFQIAHDKCYWLVNDQNLQKIILCILGPNDWSAGCPNNYEYLARVKWLGDYSWIEVDLVGNPV